MRRRLLLSALPLLLCLLLVLPQAVSAEVLAGVHLGYGRTNYSQVLGHKDLSNSEWSAGIWANYHHEELLFTALYHGSLGLQDFGANRHLAHVGANYRFLVEDILQVYGGLGYHLVSTRFETPEIDSGERHVLTGHGFTGQVVVDIALSEEFKTSATVVANPWAKWSHQADKVTDANIDSAPAFVYKIELNYDVSEDFGAHLSLLGNTYKVPAFTRSSGSIGETKSSSVSINLGVTRKF